MIAGYRVLEQLGQGGFARVYRAEQEQTRRIVALKILDLDAAEDEEQRERRRKRFWRETALCADLHHPHIVGLLDRGETDGGALFAAYAYVPGETLAAYLRRWGALSAPETGELMGQVLDALACAHASGVIHRDLKPDNIMVTQTGSRPHAVVLDFGIGALTEEARRGDYRELTLTREAVGTPAYAAPEQLRGAPPTPKSDVYAWALVFLECLTGEPTVSGDSLAEVIRRQLDPAELALPAGLVSTPLGALLRRASRKLPAERAGDAAQLHAELRQLNLAGVVGVARGAGHGARRPCEPTVTAEAERPGAELGLGGEQRQVTVLCCSLDVQQDADSSPELERLEAAQRAAMAQCRDVMERFGGWVAGSLAARLLVYFGYPHARDDGAPQAAHAALAALARVQACLGADARVLEPRMTLHTGPVIIRERGPEDGITQAMAMKLASSTPAGGVGATAGTARLLERDDSLVVTPLDSGGGRLLLVRARAGADAGRPGAEPLVERERELERLEEAFRAGADGAAVIAISGEAGTGKSMLVEAFAARVRARGESVHVARCHPEERVSALWPMLKLLRETWGISAELEPAEAARVLEAELGALELDVATATPVLSIWLGLPIPDAAALPRQSPDRQKALLFEVLERALAEAGAGARGLLILEDAHWADPTTLELVASLADRQGAPGRRMLLVTARREEDAPMLGARATRLALPGLTADGVAELAARLLGAPLAPAAAHQIHERTGGVPWFVRELVRMLVEERLLVRDGPMFTMGEPSGAVTVPATLRDALTARLGRLGPARETATLAAALGCAFSGRLLARVSDKPAAEVEADLAFMLERDVVVAEADAGRDAAGPRYAFRHALIREVAYQALLQSARARVHGRIAEVLERELPELVRLEPAAFSRHLAAAGRVEEAVDHGTRAAEGALSRAANAEARAQAEAVLEWVRGVPEPRRVDAELRANGVLTQALMATRGWADPEVKARVDLSTRLLAQHPDPELEVRTRWALMTYHYVASQRAELARLTREFSELAGAGGDRSLRIAARTFSGLVEHGAGRYLEAERGLSAARGLYDPERDRDHGRAFGLDAWVWSTATLALVRWFRGEAAPALRLAEEAIAWAHDIDHVPSLGIALLYAANLHHYAKDKAQVAELARQLVALDARYGFPAYRAYAAVLGAWADGDRAAGPAIVSQLQGMGCTAALSYYASLAGETAAEQGDHRAAVELFSACVGLCAAHDERYYEAELHYQRALSLARLGERQASRDALARARALGREQGAHWVEQRAASELGEAAPSEAGVFG